MNIEKKLEIIKSTKNEYIVFVKIGAFYRVYGKDASIISYLSGYEINKNEIGFPLTSLTKVTERLIQESINYVEASNGEDGLKIDREQTFYENNYLPVYNKAKRYIMLKNRIDEISNYLMNNINSENIRQKLNDIEDILYYE